MIYRSFFTSKGQTPTVVRLLGNFEVARKQTAGPFLTNNEKSNIVEVGENMCFASMGEVDQSDQHGLIVPV